MWDVLNFLGDSYQIASPFFTTLDRSMILPFKFTRLDGPNGYLINDGNINSEIKELADSEYLKTDRSQEGQFHLLYLPVSIGWPLG